MSTRAEDRRFATILFTDIVGSTDVASELGDARWQDLVRRHHAIVRRELRRFGGREMDTAGDGFFATFESPGAAIRAAGAITDAVREVGVEVRAGLHGGEVESRDGKAGGIAVNTAARVMAVGGPGEVLVSSSLRDVVAGSSLAFEDHGVHHLKGIEGEWRLFRLAGVDGTPTATPLEPDEASRRRLALEPERRPRTRRLAPLLVGGAATLAVVAGLAFALTDRQEGDPREPVGPPSLPPAGPPADALVEIDTRTGEVVLVRSDVPAGAVPGFAQDDLVAGVGSVWLLRPPHVWKIDPGDGSSSRVDAEGRFAQDIDVGLDAVWVIGERLQRIDAATGVATESIRLPRAPDIPTFNASVAVGSDDVWVGTRGPFVIRYDPATEDAELIRLAEDGTSVAETVATGETLVWLLDEFAGVVWRVDQATGEALEPIPMHGGLDRIAVGDGFVWVLDTSLGTLTPIVEETGDVRPAIDVGEEAADVAVGIGSVWVASGGTVLEIEPGTHQVVDEIEVGDGVPILRLTVDATTFALWLEMASSRSV